METKMFVNEFDTPAMRFNKIQSYLRENFGFEIDAEKMTFKRANTIIRNADAKLRTLSESKNNKDYARLKMISEGLKLWKLSANKELAESIDDQGMQQAKVIIAAQELTDKVQKMIEDVAELQVKDIVQISDAMKSEIGASEAERFLSSTDSSLGELLDLLKKTKSDIGNAILAASGAPVPSDMEMDMGDMEGPEMPQPDAKKMPVPDDEFGGDDAAAGAPGPEGRELKAESAARNKYLLALKEMKKHSRNGKISKKTARDIAKGLK